MKTKLLASESSGSPMTWSELVSRTAGSHLTVSRERVQEMAGWHHNVCKVWMREEKWRQLIVLWLIWANFHLLGEWENHQWVPAAGHEKQPGDSKCKLILQKWLGIEILKIIFFIKENQFVISYQLAINSECQYSTYRVSGAFRLQEW